MNRDIKDKHSSEKDITELLESGIDTQDISQLFEKSPTEFKKLIIAASRTQHYQGPVPHPKILKEYEEILPGSAERMLSMAEKEQNHRHQMEIKEINIDQNYQSGETKREQRGQYLAAFIALFSLSLSYFLALNEHAVLAGIIGGTTVVGLVSAFLIGRKQLDEEEKPSD